MKISVEIIRQKPNQITLSAPVRCKLLDVVRSETEVKIANKNNENVLDHFNILAEVLYCLPLLASRHLTTSEP